jgi:hypothetical protein
LRRLLTRVSLALQLHLLLLEEGVRLSQVLREGIQENVLLGTLWKLSFEKIF